MNFKTIVNNIKALGNIPLRNTPLEIREFLANFSFSNVSKQTIVKDAFNSNPYIYLVVDRIASECARLKRYFKDLEGNEISINDVKLLSLLDNPNQIDSQEEMYYRLFVNYLLLGDSYLVGNSGIVSNNIEELIVPTSSNVTINQDRAGLPKDYQINWFNTAFTAEKENVLHLYKPNMGRDDLEGFSPMDSSRKVWQSNNEVWASEASLHKNKGINGVLFGNGDRILRPDEQQQLQKQYDQRFTGTDNFGKVGVFSSKLGYLSMGMNPTDLKSIETRIEHLRTICAIYNVSSQLFGDVASTTFNNMEAAEKAFYTRAVLPLCYKIDIEFSKWLLPKFGLTDVIYCVDKSQIEILSKPNLELRKQILEEFKAGLIDQNKAIELINQL